MFSDMKSNKAAYLQSMFTAIAGNYDLFNSLLSLRRDSAWRKFAASECGLKPDGLALDVATGTGEFARHVLNQYDRSSIIGIDFCSEMLLYARGKLASLSGGKMIEVVLGDGMCLPFPDNVFDCATIGFALRNVADIQIVFSEIARVVKPEGRVVSLELTRPSFPPARALHDFILFWIAPSLGRLLSGNREAYTYLPNSIVEFASPEEVKLVMEKAGLQKVKIHRLTFGMATVHVAVKGI